MDKLAKTPHELQAVMKALDKVQAVIWFTPDGTIIEANANFCECLGYRQDEIVGKHHRMFVEPEYAASSDYSAFWRKLASGEFVAGGFTRIAKNGSKVYLDASYNAIFDENGEVTKVVKFANDVTKRTEENAHVQARIGAISRSQAVIEFTPDGTIIEANENFLNAMGYRLDEIQNRHHRIFLDQEQAASPEYADFWRKLAQGEFLSSEFKRKTKNGTDIWMQATYNPILDPSGKVTGVIKFATNITERKVRTARLIASVADLSNDIATDSAAIAEKSNDLSKRSETQAATVEQTSAAMEEISATVSSNAKHAQDANDEAKNAKVAAEKGGEVVNNAIGAMKRIEDGSREIRKFIEVIDSIAFQTNLLALNAGVEAARAGDAGRGFAVVASEVRALAQRASESAKDINALIDSSGREVEEGARLVNDAGQVLGEILEGVTRVSDGVESIYSASREQAEGIQEINAAIATIDKDTQRNATMSQDSADAAANLARSSEELIEVVDHYRGVPQKPKQGLRARGQNRSQADIATPPRPARITVTQAERKIAVNGSAIPDNDDDWTEF